MSAHSHILRPSFTSALSSRIMVFDGAMSTSLHAAGLTAADYGGAELEGCSEVLVTTRPDVVEAVHRSYLEAGADVIETNTFGANGIVLAAYGIAERTRELNERASRIARKAADSYATRDKPRFVAGCIGPTTKLPSLGHVEFAELRDCYRTQIAGLMAGGVDLLCIETCQDMLQAKAALSAAMIEFEQAERDMPVVLSLTFESTGTMLTGTDVAAAIATFEAYGIITMFGMNCATGPEEMEENLQSMSEFCPRPLLLMPNAGMPEYVDEDTRYKLSPGELERLMERFVVRYGIAAIGGCCGTTPAHIARLSALAEGREPASRKPMYAPSISSLYVSQSMCMEPAPMLIGERCNANGSRNFRELLFKEDWEGITALARDQVREGAHALDVCTAYAGRDESRDMLEIVRRFNTQIQVPLMIDSSDLNVIETALQCCAGRCIINSVSLEDGGERLRGAAELCRMYGAAVVALCIDENGMAADAERKIATSVRIHDILLEKGLREQDMIFDVLTFTLGSGDEEFRKSAEETLTAISGIKSLYPCCFTCLGVSNVSFGLNPYVRRVLNSVFLAEAIDAGLDMAIVDAGKILPLYRIDEEGKKAARMLIHDERRWS